MYDLTGQKFGRLLVVRQADFKRDKQIVWHCLCDCGNEVDVRSHSLRCGETTSCGCYFRERRSIGQSNGGKAHFEDLVGKRFSRLLVVKHLEAKKGNHKYLCLCDCGNTAAVWASALRTGATKSCGCYNRDRLHEVHFKDLTGQQFGRWTVLEQTASSISKGGKPMSRYLCECQCGNRKILNREVLTSGSSQSCGCIGKSVMEATLCELLQQSQIPFIREYKFHNLLGPGGRPLMFDFAITNKQKQLVCLIECQGKQHYVPNKFGFGDQQRLITDRLKKDYCTEHNIILHEIKYNEDLTARFLQICNALHDNTVPSDNKSKV